MDGVSIEWQIRGLFEEKMFYIEGALRTISSLSCYIIFVPRVEDCLKNAARKCKYPVG